jgi:hypothetical protein
VDIEFATERDPEYVRRMVRDAVRYWAWFGSAYCLGWLLVSVLCFTTGNGFAVLAGLLALVLGAVSWRFVGSPTRRVMEQLPPHTGEPRTFTITNESLTRTSPGGSVQVPWSSVTRAVARPHAYILRQGRSRFFHDIPRSSLTPEQDDELRDFLIARALLPAPAQQVAATPGR